MSSAASSGPKPSRRSASWTGAAGAVNHRPGSPATCSPMSVPLRDMSVTSVDPAVPVAASDAHFAAAMTRFRKKRWLPASTPATSSPPSAAKAGSSRRQSRFVVAWLRMCSSSPICSPWAARSRTSIGPVRSSRRASSGPARSRRKRARSIASSSPTPNHSVRPGPSLSVEKARAPEPSSCTTQTGHRGRADAGHRPDVAELVAAAQAHLADVQPLLRLGAIGGPALEQAGRHQRAALRIAHALPVDRRPRVQQRPALEPVDHLTGRGDGQHVRARAFERAQRRRVGRLHRARRARPTPAPAAPRHRPRRPPAGASRRRPPRPPARAPRRRTTKADVDGAHALQHAGARVMPDLAHLAAAVRAAPGLRPSASCACSIASPFALDGDDGAVVAHGDGRLVVCGEAIAPRAARRRSVRGRRRRGGHQRGRRARHGRAPARAGRHADQPRPRARRARARRARMGGRAARRARRRRAPHAGRAGGAVGLLHGQRDDAAARERRAAGRRAAGRLLPAGSARRGPADLHARCATAIRRSCARTARRSWRSPSAGCAAPRATSPCRAWPARCCSCSSSPAAAPRWTSTASRAPTGSRSSAGC